jgi:hypothetical protein
MWFYVLWPFVCAWSQATCSDRLHDAAGIKPCHQAQVGETCYRPGQSSETKQVER